MFLVNILENSKKYKIVCNFSDRLSLDDLKYCIEVVMLLFIPGAMTKQGSNKQSSPRKADG